MRVMMAVSYVSFWTVLELECYWKCDGYRMKRKDAKTVPLWGLKAAQDCLDKDFCIFMNSGCSYK